MCMFLTFPGSICVTSYFEKNLSLDIPTTAWIWKNFLKKKNLCLWFLIMMYLPGIHSAHRMYRLMFFTNFGSFSSLFLQMFFLRPSVSSLLLRLHHFCVGALDGMHLYSFSFIFYFLPLRLRNLNWTVFMFSGYSDSSYLLLSPSSELFISVIVLFNSRISTLSFFL